MKRVVELEGGRRKHLRKLGGKWMRGGCDHNVNVDGSQIAFENRKGTQNETVVLENTNGGFGSGVSQSENVDFDCDTVDVSNGLCLEYQMVHSSYEVNSLIYKSECSQESPPHLSIAYVERTTEHYETGHYSERQCLIYNHSLSN